MDTYSNSRNTILDLEKGAGVFVESFRVSKFLKGIKHKGPQNQKFFLHLQLIIPTQKQGS